MRSHLTGKTKEKRFSTFSNYVCLCVCMFLYFPHTEYQNLHSSSKVRLFFSCSSLLHRPAWGFLKLRLVLDWNLKSISPPICFVNFVHNWEEGRATSETLTTFREFEHFPFKIVFYSTVLALLSILFFTGEIIPKTLMLLHFVLCFYPFCFVKTDKKKVDGDTVGSSDRKRVELPL